MGSPTRSSSPRPSPTGTCGWRTPPGRSASWCPSSPWPSPPLGPERRPRGPGQRGAWPARQTSWQLRRLSRLKADELIKAAKTAEKTVTPLLHDIARGEGAKLRSLPNNIKKLDSLTRKINDQAVLRSDGPVDELVRLEASKIKDVLRYTVESDKGRYMYNYEAVTTKLGTAALPSTM